MDTPMTRKTAEGLAKLIIIGMLVQLLVIGYVFYQSYEGRADLVSGQRAGCERSKIDRNVNALGWRTAEKRSLSQDQPQFAKIYRGIASSLEKRGRISCSEVFPKASLLP